jgi:hypothetical protein
VGQASKQAQTITTAKAGAGGLVELRAQQQPLSPSVKRVDAEAAHKVMSPVAPAVLQRVQADEHKGGENVSPNLARDVSDDAEKKTPALEQQQQQQQQPEHITLRRSSRAKRISPALSSVDTGGSGGSESDSHTPRTSDAGIGKTDSPVPVHVQGHAGAANAVAWTSARDFISVGNDGVARVWDASGSKLSAKSSFQGDVRRAV